MANSLDLRAWLREQCSDFRFDVGGVFQRNSDVSWWPLKRPDLATTIADDLSAVIP